MSFEKKQVSKKIRLIVTAALALLFAASLGSLILASKIPGTLEQQVAAYNYTQRGEITYQVQVLPNSVFPETTIGPGKSYYTKIVRVIDAELSYRFKGDKNSNPRAVYSIVASVEAPEMWSKDFVLVPPTEITSEGSVLEIKQPFSIDLTLYNEFLKKVSEELGAFPREPRLNVRANISLKAATADGPVNETLTPTMTIPLTSGEFKITGDLSPTKEGSLSRTIEVDNQGVKKKRFITTLVPTVLFGLILILFPCLTQNKTIVVDERRKLIDSIWKKHGERVVKVSDKVNLPESLNIISVDKIDELVRLADDLSKTIIHPIPDDPENPLVFLLFDGLTVYRYDLA